MAAEEGDRYCRSLAARKIRGRPRHGTELGSRPKPFTSPRPGTSARPASRPSPTRSAPESQSLFRSYGSNLPTSLTHINLSTRGSLPWRPAADVGTNRRDTSTRPSPGFSRSEGKFRTPSQLRCSSRSKPYLAARCFQGTRTLIQKRKLSPDIPTASPGHFGLPRLTLLRGPEWYAVPLTGSGIETGFPIAQRGLGSTDSCATAVHTKHLSTSFLQRLAGVFATTTKSCTDGGSRQVQALTLLRTTPGPSYSSGLHGGRPSGDDTHTNKRFLFFSGLNAEDSQGHHEEVTQEDMTESGPPGSPRTAANDAPEQKPR
ncbi:hypothetical protein WN55_06262 [Dufourea novaeangliae]|uniref:Uncharacterized protein n=1 Tax=Dufourea novaeangliae TaxID=178035 RepID=A0A154PPV9_DUFNO|nr:hypothetical protein WN55_06262 [Dufourea novaeangliae]